MFTFLHAADLHLDSPLLGLPRYDGAPVDALQGATRQALVNLVSLAIERQVAFVLLAGDLFDGDWRDFNTGLFFTAQMARLREAKIPVVALRGNHDAASVISRELPALENFHLLPVDRPGTVRLDGVDVAIVGQGFRDRAVTEDLSLAYPPRDPGLFTIGLLHTSASGYAEHETYAPCSVDGLRQKGYDYWALGHIHQRQLLESDPPIVFAGNTQGRHIRETGPKGCYLVAVDDTHRVTPVFCPLDVARWEHVQLDVSEERDSEDVLARITRELERLRGSAEGRLLAARVTVTGTTPLHAELAGRVKPLTEEVQAAALATIGPEVWVEKVRVRTAPPAARRGVAIAAGPLEELASLCAELHDRPANDPFWERVRGEFTTLEGKLPAVLRQGPDGVDPTDPVWLAGLLRQVQPTLIEHLELNAVRD